MSARGLWRLVVVLGMMFGAGAATAADLAGYYGGSCVSYRQSSLAAQPLDTIKQTVWANFESAKNGMNEERVHSTKSTAFIWAMEARWACSAAIGYLDGGHLDEESVQKCDCFHQRYLSFR